MLTESESNKAEIILVIIIFLPVTTLHQEQEKEKGSAGESHGVWKNSGHRLAKTEASA